MTDSQATQLSSPVQQEVQNALSRGSNKQLQLNMELPVVLGEIKVKPRYRFRKTGRNLLIVARDVAGVPRKRIAHEFGITPQRVGVILRGRRR